MLVFQYGSNCLDSQINGDDRLRGDAKYVDVAQTVDDYRLSFDVYSVNRGCAAANIVPVPGHKVWGALYEVPDHLIKRGETKGNGRKSLDAIEGEGKNYERRQIDVRTSNGTVHRATTYTVKEPQAGLTTSLEYVRYIVNGLRERKVPDEYISTVKATARANNPAIAAELAEL